MNQTLAADATNQNSDIEVLTLSGVYMKHSKKKKDLATIKRTQTLQSLRH